MTDDPIPEEHHISRYCPREKLTEDGCQVTGASFQLRPKEPCLSVNWLEKLNLDSRPEEIAEILRIFARKDLTVGATAKIAVLNVKEMRDYVCTESKDSRHLRVLHRPSRKDNSHSGIFDTKLEEGLIMDLLAEIANKSPLYPTR